MKPDVLIPWFKIAIKIVLSLILFAIVLKFVNLSVVYSIIRNSSPAFWPAILLALFADRILMAYKWNLLLKARGVYLPFLNVLKIYFIGNFVGFFLPITIGTDLSRLHSLSRSGESVIESASSIVVERLFGFLTLATVGIISLTVSVYFYGVPLDKLVVTLLISLLLLVLFSTALLHTNLVGRFLVAIGHRHRSKLWKKLNALYRSLRNSESTLKNLPKFCFWSVVEHVLIVLMTYALALCLHIEISIVYFFAFTPAIMLIARIPVSFNGLGVKEGLFVLFFSQVGLSPSHGFAIPIMSQMLYLVSMIPGLYFVIFGKKSWSRKSAVF